MDDIPDKDLLRLIDEHNRKELEKPCQTFADILERAEYFALTGDIKHSREWLFVAQDHVQNSHEKAELLKLTAKYERDHSIASRCYEEAAALLKSNSKEYGHLLFMAGTEAFYGKEYERALEILTNAVVLLSINDDSNSEYLMALGILGDVYFALSYYPIAVSLLTMLAELYRESGDIPEYHRTRCKIATSLKYLKDYKDASFLLKEAIAYFEANNLDLDYISATAELALCNSHQGIIADGMDDASKSKYRKESERILKSELAALKNTKKFLGPDQYARSLGVICGSYVRLNNDQKVWKYARLYVDALKDATIQLFKFAEYSERAKYWESHKNSLRIIQSLFDRHNITVGEPAAILYDIALLQKGILLSSSVELQDAIYKSGKKTLRRHYEKLRDLDRKKLPSPTESMQKERLSFALTNKCRPYKDFTSYLDYGWRNVRDHLGPGEIAVEFIVCGDGLMGLEEQLFAVVLTRGRNPRAIPVPNIEDVWEWLVLFFPANTRRIYFSPDGDVSRSSIEVHQSHAALLDRRYQIHRLSTTKALCRGFRDSSLHISSAAIFGGANYLLSDNLRYSINDVIEVRNILLEKGVKCLTFSCVKASKQAFLGLSGNAPEVIVFSGHGAYLDHFEDGMKDSILVFDGDEYLSAEEVAEMNLYGCKLVVLSACKSGLGKIEDDGVYGFQRAFKNAGVGAILMTDDSVYEDDASEQLLSFFRHLMAGKTLHNAFKASIRDTRFKLIFDWRNIADSYMLLEG